MANQQPTGFENYPAQSPRDSVGDGLPSRPAPAEVTPHQAPVVFSPSPRSGLPRRGLIALAIGVPVAGVIGSMIFSRGVGSEASGSATEGSDDSGGSDGYLDVGGEQYTTAIADGWESIGGSGEEAILTNGSNRLLALAITDDGSQDVTDYLLGLVEEYRDTFKGRLGQPVDTSSTDVRRATLAATGNLAGKDARIRADVWLDSSDNGLLVIQTLTARKGSRIATEAQSMADELSSGF